MTRRVHNSIRPLSGLMPIRQGPPSRKPEGLWWAKGDEWTDLVRQRRGAAGRKKCGAHNYEVHLGEGFRLLQIDSFDAALDLSRSHACPMPHSSEGFFWQEGDKFTYDPDQDPTAKQGVYRAFMIDWAAVAKSWDGVEITIEVGQFRGNRPRIEWLDTDWDIPSGCVWRTRNVSLSPMVKDPEPEAPDL